MAEMRVTLSNVEVKHCYKFDLSCLLCSPQEIMIRQLCCDEVTGFSGKVEGISEKYREFSAKEVFVCSEHIEAISKDPNIELVRE